jgi:GNAT superfamily N-acetyltransferase
LLSCLHPEANVREGYTVRSAVPSDVSRLPEIERAASVLFAEFGLANLLARVLTPVQDLEEGLRAGRLWVATAPDDALVGFALASVVGGNGHLEELDVLPDHGRRGVGTALVEAFLRWARESAFSGVTLTTLRHVPWNASFYERFGFRVLGPKELTPALSDLLRSEVERGLPAKGRVAMYRPIG